MWALRGAGGGVGVVLAFEIEATPTTDVGVAQLVYDGAVLPDWAATLAEAPRVLTTAGTLFGTDRPELKKLWEPVQAHATGAYVNFESATGPDVFRRAYPGATGERVRELWDRYDPDAVLRPLTSGRE